VLWLIAIFIGGLLCGYFICALMVMSSRESRYEEEYHENP
jgi:hypothetical protein